MFVLPLKGDKIETRDGVVFTVLSFTNYRDRGPAVYVEHTAGVPSDAVYFFDIIKINEKHVEYQPGAKVFKVAAKLKRKFQLPQLNDTVTFKGADGSTDAKVVGLKLHKRGELAKGLLVVAESPDTEEKHHLRLDQLIDIQQDIGSDLFSREAFLRYYDDYRGTR